MGIPLFYGEWLSKQNTPGLLRRDVPSNVASFILDMNGLLHAVAQKVYAYGDYNDPIRQRLLAAADPRYLEVEYHQAVVTELTRLIALVQPTTNLVLAIDGVAPYAKIQQQRQRRYKSILTPVQSNYRRLATGVAAPEKPIFNSNAITPGTDFMISFDSFFRRWLVANRTVLPPNIVYSSHLVPGEGEHKIMDLFRGGLIAGEDLEGNPGAHIIYGMDADLVLLSLVAPATNIYLMREDTDVVNIDTLKIHLNAIMRTETAAEDFLVMMSLIGNDFLPHPVAFEGSVGHAVETLLTAYRDINTSLTVVDEEGRSDVYLPSLALFIKQLATYEPSFISMMANNQPRYPSRVVQAATKVTHYVGQGERRVFNPVDFRDAWYSNALGVRTSDTQLINYAVSVVPDLFPITESRVVDMCINYISGLAWVYNYYRHGLLHINIEYLYRYSYAPFFSDIAEVAEQITAIMDYLPVENSALFSPVHQLVAVLPPQSKDLMPIEVQWVVEYDSTIVDMFPWNVPILLDGKNEQWQGLAILPPLEPLRIIEAVASSEFTEERLSLYNEAETLVLISTQEDLVIRRNEQNRRRTQARREEARGRPQGGRPRGRGVPRGVSRDTGHIGGRGRGYSAQTRGRGRGVYRGRAGGVRGRGTSVPTYTQPGVFL